MHRIIKFSLLIFILAGFLAPQVARPQNQADVYKKNLIYFYRDTCPHCQNVKPVLKDLEKKYKDEVKFRRYEITTNQENRNLFFEFLDAYGIPRGRGGVPLVFIGDAYLLGDVEIKDDLASKIDVCLEANCQLKNGLDDEVGGLTKKKIASSDRSKLTLGLIIGAGFIDSINPCAIAVLLFLIAFILAIKSSKKRLLAVGLAYIIVVFITYLAAGIGLLKFIGGFGLAKIITIIAAILLVIVGMTNVKDFFWPNKGISFKIPDRAKPLLERFLKKATIPAVMIAGFLVAVFELPCTGEIYLGILSLLAGEGRKIQGLGYLVLYNVIFVLPLLVILLAAVFGLDISRIERTQVLRKKWIRLLIGLGMVALGFWLIWRYR